MQYDKLFTMSDNKDTLKQFLKELKLTPDEAIIYIELLCKPQSHLELSRSTGINRTKVYRVVEQLEKRSLISSRFGDNGAALVASDPATLEVELVSKEEELKRQRDVLNHILPALKGLKEGSKSGFVVHTYEGSQGFKQMLWHELKTEGEMLSFGAVAIENLVSSRRWSEKHRAMTIEANYTVRELGNPGLSRETKDFFTKNLDFIYKHFEAREIQKDVLLLEEATAIYNDTVATYYWRGQHKIGVEIISKSYAQMMRQMFEHYWSIAEPFVFRPKD